MYCIYDVYTKNTQCSIYNEYAWYITGISQPDWYIHGIYVVRCAMGLFSTFFNNNIPVIYHEYSMDKHDISKVYHYKKGIE